MEEPSWERAFVAVSMTLGATYDDARAAIGDRACLPPVLERAFSSTDRNVRARGLAAVLAEVARDVDAMRLA